MKQINVKIIAKEKLAEDCFKMSLESAYLKKASKPGQFVNIKCSDTTSPLLKRPFGIYRITDKGIEILFKVVGQATTLLAKKEKGELLTLIGPLGEGFDLNTKKKEILFVAGGYGVVPLYAAAEQLKKQNKNIQIKVFLGGKTKKDIFCADDFEKLNVKVFFSTNDGSLGHKGFVTSLLMKEIVKHDPKNCIMYVCGPEPLLQAVSNIAKEEKIKTQVSMEGYLACGIGVCMGCAIDTVNGKKLICKDGPVFNAEDLLWAKEESLEQQEDKRMNL